MKFNKKLKFLFLFLFLCGLGIFTHSTPSIAEETVIKSKIDSIDKVDMNLLKNNYKVGNLKRSNSKIFSLESRFNAFPENLKIDLTLREMDVASVLRIIAEEGHKNIVLDKSVQGIISAELKNVSLNDAMQTILVSEELEARVEGNTIFVASRPAMARKGLNRKVIKAFKLNNSNAVDVARIIEASIFNKGYRINPEESGAQAMQAISPANNVQPSAEQGAAASTNNASAATSTGQSTVLSSKVVRGKVETLNAGEKFSDASKLASEIKLQSITSGIQNVEVNNNDGGAIVIPDTRTNTLLVAGLKEDIDLAQDFIKQLDKPLPQVAIDVSLIEIKKTDANDIGLSIGSDVSNYGSAGFNASVAGSSDFANVTEIGYSTLRNINREISLKLKALVQTQKAKLLANPTILALDNSESLIKITDRIISKMDITVTETSINYNPTLEDIGIVLNILPKISEDGYITMRIRPSITTPLEKQEIGNDGAFATLIQTREVILQDARVKSGETLAIAGLLKESEVTSIGKIPLMGDLPLLGKIFRNNEKERVKSELLIFITPRIIEDIATN